MKAERILIVTCGLIVLAWAGATFGDGGMFFRNSPYNRQADIFQPTQKVYIRWDGSQERLLIQTKYEGPAEEMVWIVPVPSKPAVALDDGVVFEELSKETAYLDVSYTNFTGLQTWSAGGTTRRGTSPVEWRQQIGVYEVVLLRPIGEEDVVQWLQSNDFAIPDEIVPVLNDYIRNQWWMVASKIHPDALANITREKLAQGLLHPLEMTFESSACIYPLRLTRMAAGPVEELIYIEGPTHYEPLTLPAGNWEISIFGGAVRQLADRTHLSDLEAAVRIREGKTTTTVKRYLTKLRRVFEPAEMAEDLVFRDMDYALWLMGQNTSRIAQAATQYGRSRDPNGIPYLLSALSPIALEQVRPAPGDYSIGLPPSARFLSWEGMERQSVACRHLRSCIWALGEIGIEQEAEANVEEVLLSCARHDNQLIRMEAYIALVKLGSTNVGSVFTHRVSEVLIPGLVPLELFWFELAAEMDIVIAWLGRFGTTGEKDGLVTALAETIAHLPTGREYYRGTWPEWVVRQAALAPDGRLLEALDGLLGAIPADHRWTRGLLLRVEAMCGSAKATELIVAELVADEAHVLQEGSGEGQGGYASLCGYFEGGFHDNTVKDSLRSQILTKPGATGLLYPLGSQAADAVVRLALEHRELTNWYTLYLLALIAEPQPQDKDRLMAIFYAGDAPVRMVAVDVLYVWNDVPALFALCDAVSFADTRSEAAWVLAHLGLPEAVDLVEEQVLTCWSAEIAAVGEPFLNEIRLMKRYGTESAVADALRKWTTVLNYFHPRTGSLDEARLAALKRLACAESLHPGWRFSLIGSSYGQTDWGRPLLEKAARDILATSSEAWVVGQVGRTMIVANDGEFVVRLCAETTSDEFRRDILIGLLDSMDSSGRFLPLIEELLGGIWPQRYIETGGQSLLFREPGDLAASIDKYILFSRKALADSLVLLVKNVSLPAGYRAFLLVYWPGAPQRFSRDFVEALLEEDMPEFIREALRQRLSEWP